MEPPGGVGGQSALAGQFDQFVVAATSLLERVGVRVAQDGHEHAVLGFDGEADVDGRADGRFCCR